MNERDVGVQQKNNFAQVVESWIAVPCATQRVLVDHNTPWGCGEGAPQPECIRVLDYLLKSPFFKLAVNSGKKTVSIHRQRIEERATLGRSFRFWVFRSLVAITAENGHRFGAVSLKNLPSFSKSLLCIVQRGV